MKQVLQHARTGEIKVEEVPVPKLLPGCVLVRVAACERRDVNVAEFMETARQGSSPNSSLEE